MYPLQNVNTTLEASHLVTSCRMPAISHVSMGTVLVAQEKLPPWGTADSWPTRGWLQGSTLLVLTDPLAWLSGEPSH